MQISPLTNQRRPTQIVATALVISLMMPAAYAQTGGHAPAATQVAPAEAGAPSNAELQKEIQSLREQIQQLQKAQKSATPAKHSGSTGSGKKPPAGTAPPAQKAAPPAGGMGMMDDDMDEKDDAMEMPPADPTKPDPMSGGMGHM